MSFRTGIEIFLASIVLLVFLVHNRSVQLDTIIVISKGFAYVLVGVFTPWTAALAQWVNANQWPERIVWVGVLLPLSVVGGASAWASFTSGDWVKFRQQKRADDTGETQTTEVKPNSPKLGTGSGNSAPTVGG